MLAFFRILPFADHFHCEANRIGFVNICHHIRKAVFI